MLVCAGLALVVGSGVAFADAKKAKDQDMRGQIVRVDPIANTIVVKVGTGDTAKEMTYKVTDATKYWGSDRQSVSEGLKFKGFKDGTDVWFRTGTGADNMTITELRLFDPALKTPGKEKP
jgi:hypothetical protein